MANILPAGTLRAKGSLISAQTPAQKGDSLINLGKPNTWGNTGCRAAQSFSPYLWTRNPCSSLPLHLHPGMQVPPRALQRETGADSVWWCLVKPSDKVTRAQLRKCSALDLTLQQNAAVAFGLLVLSSFCFSMTTGWQTCVAREEVFGVLSKLRRMSSAWLAVTATDSRSHRRQGRPEQEKVKESGHREEPETKDQTELGTTAEAKAFSFMTKSLHVLPWCSLLSPRMRLPRALSPFYLLHSPCLSRPTCTALSAMELTQAAT